MARPRYHLATSAAIGGAFWLATRDRRALVAPFFSGFLIDFDHFVDYFAVRVIGHGSMFLPLHGWEFVPVWWGLDRLLRARGALLAGYVAHLAIDQVANEKRSHLAYLVTWRASKGFRSDQLGPADPAQRHKWRNESLLGLLRWF